MEDVPRLEAVGRGLCVVESNTYPPVAVLPSNGSWAQVATLAACRSQSSQRRPLRMGTLCRGNTDTGVLSGVVCCRSRLLLLSAFRLENEGEAAGVETASGSLSLDTLRLVTVTSHLTVKRMQLGGSRV